MLEFDPKWQLITNESRFLDTLFVNVIKENTSLYFFKCLNILQVLKLISEVRFIRTYGEFWFKIEDLILRMRKDLSVAQTLEIVELYAGMACGSQIFWGELEEHLIVNSSQLRHVDGAD